jgi:hypothetical protein
MSDQRSDQNAAGAPQRGGSRPWLSPVELVQKTMGASSGQLKERAHEMAEQQKAAGAQQIGEAARAIEAAAGDLKDKMPLAAEFVEDVAARLDALASTLTEHSVDEMLGNVAGFARRQPAVFFAGAIAAGLALSRFAKSSGNREG